MITLVAEYDALQETLEVLGDEAVLDDLRQSEEDVLAGHVTDWDDVKRDLRLTLRLVPRPATPPPVHNRVGWGSASSRFGSSPRPSGAS
jgi:hypothetical protein